MIKRFVIAALLILCFTVSAFATGVTWFGNVGLGTSKDNAGFIVFKDSKGQYTYVWIDANAAITKNQNVTHSLVITHSGALYVVHSPQTDVGYFNLTGKGVQLLRP